MTETLKDRLLIATMCSNWQQVADKYGLAIETDHFCQAENMDGEMGDRAKATLAELMKKHPVKVIHAPFNELHPAAIDYKARALAMDRLNQAAGIAIDFGIKKMVVHSGYVPFVYFKEWHRDRSVEFWQEFMEDKPDDFEICIENVLDDEPYTLVEIVKAVDDRRVGLCLDVGHANIVRNVMGGAVNGAPNYAAGCEGNGSNLEQWLEVMAPYLKHLHIHNNNGTGDFHNELMDGTIDIAGILQGVSEKCSKDTTITLELITCEKSVEWLASKGLID